MSRFDQQNKYRGRRIAMVVSTLFSESEKKAQSEPAAPEDAAQQAPVEAEEAAVEEAPAEAETPQDEPVEEEPPEMPAVIEDPQETPAQSEEVASEEAPAEAEPPEVTVAAEEPSLDALEPRDVFHYFREIAAIPHGSFHTEGLSDYLEEFAKSRGLEYVRDEAGNLIIYRPGSPGYEETAPVALQGHVDMVLDKEESLHVNLETEPISLQTDGEWLWADRSTLGGDDGIAVAIMLALLADETLKCPPLECIFTVDEEVGMLGAAALDLSSIKSRRMINIDSEEEGVITAACAGGVQQVCTLAGRRVEKKGRILKLEISGLRGGHSGEMIGSGRANAILLLARLLYRLREEGKFCVVSFHGGTKENAIPRSASAEIIFTEKISGKEVKSAVSAFSKDIRKEYAQADPDISVSAKWEGKDRRIAFSHKDSMRMVQFLMALPNGVLEYTSFDRDIPQTSVSLGIVKTMADGLMAVSLARSSIDSQKQMLMDKFECIAGAFEADIEVQGPYSAWEFVEKSPFRELAASVYRSVLDREAKVTVTHGGLECGLFVSRIPGLDCFSVGPDMEGIHTAAERLNVFSSARVYAFIRALLGALCSRDGREA